jgi:hypothetical protein
MFNECVGIKSLISQKESIQEKERRQRLFLPLEVLAPANSNDALVGWYDIHQVGSGISLSDSRH